MNRLWRLLVPILLLVLPGHGASAQDAAPGPRQVVSLADGWRFHFGPEDGVVTAPGFDDSNWEQVSVPHTWNRIGEYALTRSAATDNRQGIGWYRLNYQAPQEPRGKRFYLDFAAVGNIADVWVNGLHVGQHQGAYSRFRFDVTDAWRPGQTNLIVVRADNSKRDAASATGQVIPLAGDFFIYGGIYRGVELITASDVGIDLLDHGGPGVYVRTASIAENGATLAATVRLRNAGTELRKLKMVTTVTNSEWRMCNPEVVETDCGFSTPARVTNWSDIAETEIPGGGSTEVQRTFPIDSVHLWNGRNDPHQYSITVRVFDGRHLLDSVTQSFGIRTIAINPNQGLSLNGNPLQLRGVSRHQDRQGRGAALTRADHAEDMALIRELGANTVRHAHYQHADEWSEEADRAGMLVWAEVPFVTTPSFTGGEGSAEVWANAELQLRELIRQNYNHPSIAMWSIGNESDAAQMFGSSREPVNPRPLLERLHQIAREEDPSRPTTYADCCESMPGGRSAAVPLAGAADLIGYNRYYGWYMPQPLRAAEQLGADLDRLHAAHPSLPISISEYGAGGAMSQHSDNVTSGFANYIGRPQPEEYQAWVMEQSWPVLRERRFVFASWIWNMFDFASDLRNEGDSVDINTKGLVSFDRQTRKDAFYYFKAQWNPVPMLWLTGKRYAERPYPVMEVRAYSNAERARLTVEGRDLGEVACVERICAWANVPLAPGANRAVVTAMVGSERQGESDVPLGYTIMDEAIFYGPDPMRGLRINSGDLASGMIGGQPYGSDNFVTGGTPMALNLGGFGGQRAANREVIASQPELYAYWREGEAFSYAIPVPNGSWAVTVHTFQPDATSRTMSANAQGRVALPAFDPGTGGGPLHGTSATFTARVTDGLLRRDFAGQGGKAVVAAIELTPNGR